MIHCTSAQYHKNGNSLKKLSTKSNSLKGSIREERKNMTSPPPSIHFDIGILSNNVRSSLRGFHKRSSGAGLLQNRINTPKSPSEVKKDREEEQTGLFGVEDRNNFPTEYLANTDLILGCDRHDQMPFSWKEIADDLHILSNQNSNPILSGFPAKFNDFGSISAPSVPRCKKDLHAKGPNHVTAPVSLTRHKHWTPKEDEMLRSATMAIGTSDWGRISKMYFNSSRTETQCKNRWKNHLQPGLVRGDWSSSEDKLILKMVGDGFMWREIAMRLPGRTGENIRGRYVNHLDPTLKKSPWTREEDEILFNTQRKLGNKWSEIRKFLPGRSSNSIKNRYHNKKTAYFRKIKRRKEENNHKIPTKDFSNPTETGVDGLQSTMSPTFICFDGVSDPVLGI